MTGRRPAFQKTKIGKNFRQKKFFPRRFLKKIFVYSAPRKHVFFMSSSPFFIRIRTRYNETDQMGYIHHGVYPAYLEMARIEWLKQFGISYKQMEINGILLPVYKMNIKYFKPLTFDESIRVFVKPKVQRGARLSFAYEIYNEENIKTTEAVVELVFTNRRGKPIKPPREILEKLTI